MLPLKQSRENDRISGRKVGAPHAVTGGVIGGFGYQLHRAWFFLEGNDVDCGPGTFETSQWLTGWQHEIGVLNNILFFMFHIVRGQHVPTRCTPVPLNISKSSDSELHKIVYAKITNLKTQNPCETEI